MKVKFGDPDTDSILIAFNGEVVGFVTEADDVEGYIVQGTYGPEVQFLIGPDHPAPVQFVRKEGKVAILGDTDKDSRETILANFNKHRADCGLPAFNAANA